LRQNLWLVPAGLWRTAQTIPTIPSIRRCLGELRAEFDYAVIHAPPVGTSGEAGVLAQLADGLVLVLEAHRTRRVLARMTQERLQAAHVRILGAVLSGRTFPIPERLYRRL
jgi:Mrp family chromosome partitioning ATPase